MRSSFLRAWWFFNSNQFKEDFYFLRNVCFYDENFFIQRKKASSENECVCTFFFFFGYLLEVLVNDGDCQQDTSTRANSPHEVCKDGKCTDAASTESCCSWNVPVQVLDHRVFSLTINHQFLVHQLPSNVS